MHVLVLIVFELNDRRFSYTVVTNEIHTELHV